MIVLKLIRRAILVKLNDWNCREIPKIVQHNCEYSSFVLHFLQKDHEHLYCDLFWSTCKKRKGQLCMFNTQREEAV